MDGEQSNTGVIFQLLDLLLYQGLQEVPRRSIIDSAVRAAVGEIYKLSARVKNLVLLLELQEAFDPTRGPDRFHRKRLRGQVVVRHVDEAFVEAEVAGVAESLD
jgi:hypothetical protein